MVVKQKLFVNPDGSIEGLQVKKGKGVDLRQFGKANIKRASEIVWNEDNQMWFIKILVGVFKDLSVSKELFERVVNSDEDIDSIRFNIFAKVHNVLYFEDYDEAVAEEIKFLDAVRTKRHKL